MDKKIVIVIIGLIIIAVIFMGKKTAISGESFDSLKSQCESGDKIYRAFLDNKYYYCLDRPLNTCDDSWGSLWPQFSLYYTCAGDDYACIQPIGNEGQWYCKDNKAYVCDVNGWDWNSNCDYCIRSSVGTYNEICGHYDEPNCQPNSYCEGDILYIMNLDTCNYDSYNCKTLYGQDYTCAYNNLNDNYGCNKIGAPPQKACYRCLTPSEAIAIGVTINQEQGIINYNGKSVVDSKVIDASTNCPSGYSETYISEDICVNNWPKINCCRCSDLGQSSLININGNCPNDWKTTCSLCVSPTLCSSLGGYTTNFNCVANNRLLVSGATDVDYITTFCCKDKECTHNWSCGQWSNVTCGTRICTDTNNCGVTTGKPSEYNPCGSIPPSKCPSCMGLIEVCDEKTGKCKWNPILYIFGGILLVGMMFKMMSKK